MFSWGEQEFHVAAIKVWYNSKSSRRLLIWFSWESQGPSRKLLDGSGLELIEFIFPPLISAMPIFRGNLDFQLKFENLNSGFSTESEAFIYHIFS